MLAGLPCFCACRSGLIGVPRMAPTDDLLGSQTSKRRRALVLSHKLATGSLSILDTHYLSPGSGAELAGYSSYEKPKPFILMGARRLDRPCHEFVARLLHLETGLASEWGKSLAENLENHCDYLLLHGAPGDGDT